MMRRIMTGIAPLLFGVVMIVLGNAAKPDAAVPPVFYYVFAALCFVISGFRYFRGGR